jgi:NADH:ubiquinone oxidoreductase subunit 4 (subunit M)
VLFSVVFPVGADDVETDPTPASGPVVNRAGESLYILPAIDEPDTGGEYEVSASWISGTLLGDRVSDDGSSTVLIALGAFVGLLAVVLVLVMRNQRPQSDSDVGDEAPDAED